MTEALPLVAPVIAPAGPIASNTLVAAPRVMGVSVVPTGYLTRWWLQSNDGRKKDN